MFMEPSFKCQLPTFWVVQRLRLHDSTAEGVGSIPGWETTCPIFWPKEKKKKRQLWRNQNCKVPNHEALCQYKKQKTTPSGFQNQSPNVEITRMTIFLYFLVTDVRNFPQITPLRRSSNCLIQNNFLSESSLKRWSAPAPYLQQELFEETANEGGYFVSVYEMKLTICIMVVVNDPVCISIKGTASFIGLHFNS